MKNTAYVLLGIWLTATGIMGLLGLAHPVLSIAMAILAIITGIIILIGLWKMNQAERIGMILLAIWLILTGLFTLVGLGFAYSGIIAHVLQLVAGVLLLIGLKGRKTAAKIGIILLAVWLVISALVGLFSLGFAGVGVILAALAVISGIMILIWK